MLLQVEFKYQIRTIKCQKGDVSRLTESKMDLSPVFLCFCFSSV